MVSNDFADGMYCPNLGKRSKESPFEQGQNLRSRTQNAGLLLGIQSIHASNGFLNMRWVTSTVG